MIRILILLMYCAALMLSTATAAEQPFKLSNVNPSANLSPHLEFNLGNSDNADSPPIEGWSDHNKPVIQLFNTLDTYWYRASIVNDTIFASSYYLEFGNPLIDHATIYILSNGRVRTVQQLGDQQAFALRPVLNETLVVPIQLAASEEIEVYFAIQSPSYLKIPVNIWQVEAFQQEQSYQKLLNGVYVGLVMAMVIAAIFAFIYHKQVLVLFDALFLLSLLMVTLTASGIGFHYFWPKSPFFQQHAFFLFACFAMFFSALAASKNMQLFFHDVRLIRVFQGLSVISLLLIPVSFLVTYQVGLFFIIGLSILVCLSHITAGVISWRQGLHEHQELNFGLMVLLFALLVISVNTLDIVHIPISNYAILQISVLAQVLFLLITAVKSYGVAFDTFGEQTEDDVDKDLQLSEQMLELQFALKELQEKNEQLEKLNTLDELSGIHNRRHFDKRLLAELRRARRELTPISLIMFDIDHFKKFNDSYGHLAGDEVIRTVAFTASEQLNRPTDEIFRYGGEEYAVLLPNTDLSGASLLAERIRAAIENTKISSNQQELNCTVSLGVACHLSEHALKPEDMIEQADKALYQAKGNGRNRVETYSKIDN